MEKNLLNSLLTLGLTQKEAQAYHSLVRGGVMTAEDISKSINVQYPIVYRILQGLKDKGWVDSTAERPKKYVAKTPKMASDNAAQSQISVIEHSAELIDRVLTPQYHQNQELLSQEIWTVRGYSAVLRKIRDTGKEDTKVFGKITGPIDDNTFNEIFKCVNPEASIKVKLMGPPIIGVDPELEPRVDIERPYFEGKCQVFPDLPTAEAKEEFLGSVHGSRFICIHMLFDAREALWINMPYRDNSLVKEKVWANWIIDPDYIAIINDEV